MITGISVTFTQAELRELALYTLAGLRANNGFVNASPLSDIHLVYGVLRLQSARIASGDCKGVDLDLPPWAARVVLDAVAPVEPPKKPRGRRPAAAAPAVKPRRAHRRTKPAPVNHEVDEPLFPEDRVHDDGGAPLEDEL